MNLRIVYLKKLTVAAWAFAFRVGFDHVAQHSF